MNPMQVACSAWLSSCVAVAARLGVADHLAAGPRSAEELARVTGTSAPILGRLLRALAAAGIFARTGHCYTNSTDSELLRIDHPRSVRHFCMLAGTEYYRAFGELVHTVNTGQPAFRHIYHHSIYGYMEMNADAADTYDRAMEELARPVGEALAHLIDFRAAATVIDVGGGRGALLRPLLRAHPHMRGISFDREDVCRRAEAADRLQFVTGDFFAAVPAGGDIYILKNVLHNWNDDSASAILRIIAASMNAARLLVIEPLLDEHEISLPKLLDDLMQAVICEQGTSARTEGAMRGLLERASLAVTSVTPLPTGHSAIEAIVASPYH